MANPGVQVTGLKEFRRDLGKVSKELPKQLRADLLEIGKDIAADAANRVPEGRTGRARKSIKAGMSGNNAYVQGGKKNVPYYGWLDFGSRKPISGRPRSVGPWKGTGAGPKEGRFIYAAIKARRREIRERAEAAFDKARNSAGL